MKESKVSIGIASEGSFGPHPFIPFAACDHEILYFMDQERGFALHQSQLSTKTNYCAEAFSDPQRLQTFCDQALFPSHGLIVSPNESNKKTFIIKGIKAYDVLEEAFLKCCRLSDDGKALVETDMRAHMNPTRMEVIKELADSFAKRLATPCPLCYNPGWGIVDRQKGLECAMCGSETEMVKSEVFGCPKCLHLGFSPAIQVLFSRFLRFFSRKWALSISFEKNRKNYREDLPEFQGDKPKVQVNRAKSLPKITSHEGRNQTYCRS